MRRSHIVRRKYFEQFYFFTSNILLFYIINMNIVSICIFIFFGFIDFKFML